MRTRRMRSAVDRYRWDRLKVSFWFAPAVMSLGAVLLAWAMYWLDDQIPNEALANSRYVLSGSVSDLRSYLLTIAGTVLATAGVVFTLLTLPLSTVAAQYGSRLLRLFLGDRTTQLILGMFVATFVYCMAGALSIPPPSINPEGSQLTATVGLYLMLATFASLILLVQHISTMLQAPNIAAAGGAELREVVALVWPAGRVDEQLVNLIRRAIQIGNGRTPTQDVEYAVNQLTEMAVRAMSAAINDPFTAMTCLDHIGDGLAEFIRQPQKGSHFYDRDGNLRLALEPVTFNELLNAAFDMLRHASCTTPASCCTCWR